MRSETNQNVYVLATFDDFVYPADVKQFDKTIYKTESDVCTLYP